MTQDSNHLIDKESGVDNSEGKDNTGQDSLLRYQKIGELQTEFPEELQLDAQDRQAAVEALLFAAGDALSFEKIMQITGIDGPHLLALLQEMSAAYLRDRRRGLLLREVGGKYTLSTKPGFYDIITRLFQPRHRPPLSQAAYETLAIIAYNQPVTRAQVEDVRGVNSDSIISRLLERNLIEEVGKLDAPGRPSLFATTEQFLLDVGLVSVQELPPMEMLMYESLRDLEDSLQAAAGSNRDRQITIEQLAQNMEASAAATENTATETIVEASAAARESATAETIAGANAKMAAEAKAEKMELAPENKPNT